MAYIKGTCKKMIKHREGLKPYRCNSYNLELIHGSGPCKRHHYNKVRQTYKKKVDIINK